MSQAIETCLGTNPTATALWRPVRGYQGRYEAYELGRLACVHADTIQQIWKGETWKHA